MLLDQVTYDPLKPVMSCEEAIAAESYHPQYDRTIIKGDVDAVFASADIAGIVEGVARIGGQEHLYLEPHCNIVVPIEGDEYVLWSSTQVCDQLSAYAFILKMT